MLFLFPDGIWSLDLNFWSFDLIRFYEDLPLQRIGLLCTMRNVKKAKHGPPLPPLDIPQDDVNSEEDSEVEEEMEGEEDKDGSMSVEEEFDPEAVKYIEQFKIEVIEDSREKCDAKGLAMAKDLSAGAPQRFLEWVVSPMKLERFQEEFWEQRPFLIRRPKNRNYYDDIFSKASIEKLLESHELKYVPTYFMMLGFSLIYLPLTSSSGEVDVFETCSTMGFPTLWESQLESSFTSL